VWDEGGRRMMKGGLWMVRNVWKAIIVRIMFLVNANFGRNGPR